MISLAPWRPVLAKSLRLNRALTYARYFQLATLRGDGRPANRTVVLRGFAPDSQEHPAESFTLILLEPAEVDHLDLRTHPYSRHRYWCDSPSNWQTQAVNP